MKGAGRQWLKTVVTGKEDEGVQRCEELREQQEDNRRKDRQQREDSLYSEPGASLTCDNCNRAGRSIIGLYSHSRCCNSTTNYIMAQSSSVSRDR